MINTLDNLRGGRELRKVARVGVDSHLAAHYTSPAGHGPKFSKIFRWQASDPRAPIPASVELAGSFTEWQPVAMTRDVFTNTWQLVIHEIPGNRTHRYMLLVDGKPVNDRNCDGLAVPENIEEQRYQLATTRGPRVFLLFAQTK